MTKLGLPFLLFALAFAACSAPKEPASRNPAGPKMPPTLAAAARELLGPDSKVVRFGDLARDGHKQALVIEPLARSKKASGDAIQFWRAGVIEQRGTRWVEVLQCDEYLKNPKGYLAGTPSDPVSGWRLQVRQHRNDFPELDFTPIAGRGAARPHTIAVRWNPHLARYQALDSTGTHFRAELPMLQIPRAVLR